MGKNTMVVDNTNHVLYDVMRDSGENSYLTMHLDENGTPVKQTKSIVSERPHEEPFDFLSDFDLKSEVEDKGMMITLILLDFVMIMTIHIVLRCHDELEWRREERPKNTHIPQKSPIDNDQQ